MDARYSVNQKPFLAIIGTSGRALIAERTARSRLVEKLLINGTFHDTNGLFQRWDWMRTHGSGSLEISADSEMEIIRQAITYKNQMLTASYLSLFLDDSMPYDTRMRAGETANEELKNTGNFDFVYQKFSSHQRTVKIAFKMAVLAESRWWMDLFKLLKELSK